MSFGQTAQSGGYSNPNNDYTIGETINDGIQDLAWSPTSNVLVSGSWDNYVRCWEVQQQGTQFNAVAKAQIAHDGPVLCTAFSGVRHRTAFFSLLHRLCGVSGAAGVTL